VCVSDLGGIPDIGTFYVRDVLIMVLCSETSDSLVDGINISDEAFFPSSGHRVILIYCNTLYGQLEYLNGLLRTFCESLDRFGDF